MCACMFVWMYWYVQLSIAHTFEDITLLIEYIPVPPHFNLHTFTRSTSHTTTLPYTTHHTLTSTHPLLQIPHLHAHLTLYTLTLYTLTLYTLTLYTLTVPPPMLLLHVPQWHSEVHSNQEKVRGPERG